jgi:hypothetical protein
MPGPARAELIAPLVATTSSPRPNSPRASSSIQRNTSTTPICEWMHITIT